MSTFKEIRGQLIKSLASDPSPVTTGDMWYNSTSKTLKGVQAVAAWSSGGNPTVGSVAARAGAGTQTAGLMFGGTTGAPAATRINNSEEYNGSSFTEGNNLNTARFKLSGIGVQTAAMGAGGYESSSSVSGTDAVELYDGTSWSEVNNLTRSLYGIYLAGTTTAAVAAGGYKGPPSPAVVTLTQEWDGTNWSNVPGTLGTARYSGIGTGTQTAALACLGYDYNPTITTKTEEYNGTLWTTGGNASVARSALGGCGTQTATIVFGGGPVPSGGNKTEIYDGTSWATSVNLAQARDSVAGAKAGTTSAALANGGRNGPTFYNNTEEFTVAATTKTFTTS